jgi:putative ABC transport system ATP-binding protein
MKVMNKIPDMIQIEKVNRSFKIGQTVLHVLKDVDLTIEEGALLAIMGESGCGKSTLMNILGLLDQPSSGKYILNKRTISNLADNELAEARNELIGFVFQSFYLLPRLNAWENVAVPLIYRGIPARQHRDQCMEVLEKVGVADRATHKPNELSGGQCQRVAIARALVGNPSLILADEPTGALDPRVSKEIMDLFTDLNSRDGKTIIIVTHDPGVAARCRRTVVLESGVMRETT